jgi:hypothetical protein
MRHYYDFYALLQLPEVQSFVGTAAYLKHRTKRFRHGDDPHIARNQALV